MSVLPDAVQQLADLGYAVVPATAQKRPLVPWRQWTERPQTETERADLPAGDLYAILTGQLYGLVVLDFDGDEGVNLATSLKLFPNVVTGSGGWHVWFQASALPHPVKTCAAVRPGLDVRGEGGIVYVYGTSSKGTYRLQSSARYEGGDGSRINTLPAWLFPEKAAPLGGDVPAGSWDGDGAGTPSAIRVLQSGAKRLLATREGERNSTMCQVAYNVGGLVGSGTLDPEAALAALLEAANRCGAEDAERVLVYQMAEGAQVPWSAEPKPDARGIVWRSTSDTLPAQKLPEPVRSRNDSGNPAWADELQPVPYAALPTAVADLAREGWQLTAADPAFIAAACLPVLGAGLGGLVTLNLRHGWRIPASMYMGLVGAPGVAKSPAVRRAMAPIRGVESAAWQNANPSVRIAVDDVTPEKLAVLLKENARGLIVVTDELKGFFGGMGQYKGGGDGITGRDRQFYLSAWDGNPIAVDRIKRESIYVPTPTLSVLGGIQPAVFDNLTDGLQDGMLERFLLVWGEPVADEWHAEDIPLGLTVAYAELWDKLRDIGMSEFQVGLTPEAGRAWKSWYDPFHKLTPPENLAPIWHKVRTHVARFTLLYACCAGTARATADHVERAVVTAEWILSHVAHISRVAFGPSTEEKRHVKARNRLDAFLSEYCLKHNKLPSGSHILQFGPPGSRRAKDRDVLLAELGVVLPR